MKYILALILIITYLSCVSREKDTDGFVFSRGVEFINTDPDRAKAEFEKIKDECKKRYGMVLSDIKSFVNKLNEIINLFSVGSEKPATTYTYGSTYPFQIKSTELIIDALIGPLDSYSKSALDNLEFLMKIENCEVNIPYTLNIKVGKETGANLYMNGVWGDVEKQILYVVINLIQAGFNLLFSHNLDFPLSQFIQKLNKLDTSTTTGTMRSLGFLMEISEDFLEFSKVEERKKRFYEVKTNIRKVFSTTVGMLQKVEERASRDRYYIVNFKDGSGDGKLGYINDRGEDIISFAVTGDIYIGKDIYEIESPSFIFPKTFTEESMKLIETSFSKLSTESVISIKDMTSFFLAAGIESMPDILRFDIDKFFSNPKPLRKLLPHWIQISEDGVTKTVFVVEAEVSPKYRYAGKKSYIYPGDSPHFPAGTTLNLRIKFDCITVPDDKVYMVMYYIAFQDPTFANSLSTSFRYEAGIPLCGHDETEWKGTNLYSLNKVLALFSLKYGNLFAPGISLIYDFIVKK